ncbi:putative ankyrin repeat-containing domain-containing protein [Helianthus annuus]|nr:putative ankyrin repeat-containing domain-containing protein [Helianthus annuus]
MSSFWKDNYFGNRYSNDTWGSNAANEEEEVVSGVPVNQETQLPDLNKTPTPPVDEPNYPAHQVCPDYGYGYESPYVQQSGYGVENAPVDEPYYPSQQSYPGYGVYGDEGGYGSYSGYGGDGGYGGEGGYSGYGGYDGYVRYGGDGGYSGYGGEGGYSVYDRSRDEVGYGGYEEHGGYGYESRNTSLYEPSTPGNPFQVNEVGNTTAAKLLVEQNPDMTRVPNPYGNTPVKLAAWHGNKDTLKYLLTVTPDTSLPGEEGSSPYTGVAGGDLITLTIMAGFYDVALEIIESHPNIVLENDRNGKTALQILALKPDIFPSGNRLGFWGNFIYSLMPMKKSEGATGVKVLLRVYNKFATRFWSALGYMAPSIKKIHDTKVNNNLSRLLVDRICKIVIEKVDHNIAWKILGSAITTAVEYGTHELIEECIITYPGIIWYDVGGFYLFLAAIKQRQERVYNLVYQMSGHKVFASTQVDGEENENALHIAAKLAPPHRLNVVTGAALQMQRELQWFQVIRYSVMTQSLKI